MSETVKVRALVNLPHWIRLEDGARMLRGTEGTIRVGDEEGDVTQADYDGKLELGMVALVQTTKPAKKTSGGSGGGDGGGEAAS